MRCGEADLWTTWPTSWPSTPAGTHQQGGGDGGGGEGEGVRACVTSELGLILEPVQEGAGDEDVAARQRLPRKVLQFRRGSQALQLRERRHAAQV